MLNICESQVVFQGNFTQRPAADPKRVDRKVEQNRVTAVVIMADEEEIMTTDQRSRIRGGRFSDQPPAMTKKRKTLVTIWTRRLLSRKTTRLRRENRLGRLTDRYPLHLSYRAAL